MFLSLANAAGKREPLQTHFVDGLVPDDPLIAGIVAEFVEQPVLVRLFKRLSSRNPVAQHLAKIHGRL